MANDALEKAGVIAHAYGNNPYMGGEALRDALAVKDEDAEVIDILGRMLGIAVRRDGASEVVIPAILNEVRDQMGPVDPGGPFGARSQ